MLKTRFLVVLFSILLASSCIVRHPPEHPKDEVHVKCKERKAKGEPCIVAPPPAYGNKII